MTNCARPGFALPCGTCDACQAHKEVKGTGLNASREYDYFPVKTLWTDPETKLRWLHLDVDAPFDWEQVKKLPAVLALGGVLYTRTGWNSDRGEVYYRSDMPAAQDVVAALKNANALLNTPVGRRKFRSEFEDDVRNSVIKALSALGEV